jgi:Tfp pilus assembly protein PilN
MIEINLLPDAGKKKRKGGAGLGLKMPSGLPAFDRMTAFIVAAWIIAPLILALMFFSVRSERAELRTGIEQAVADSARYARLIDTQAALQARQDTIAQKLFIIQEIDAGRYVWPHILDEISRALPPYTWVEQIQQQSGGTGATPSFTINGRTGSLPALTRFMDALEASPFLRNVELVSSEQARLGGGDDARIVNNYTLTASYQQPPMEMIETVPLFTDGPGLEGGEVENGTTGSS